MAIAALRAYAGPILRGVAVAALALSLLGLIELRVTHQRSDGLLSAIDVPDRAVALTTAGRLPRLDWQRFDQRSWLLVPPEKVRGLLERLRAAGVRRAFLVYPNTDAPTGLSLKAKPVPGYEWHTAEVRLS
jgi:hypothetical protein